MFLNKIKPIGSLAVYNKVTALIKGVFLIIINIYQKALSPLLGQNCKHYPSCSNYAKHSITLHGVVYGFVLTTARIIRCNPWSLGGFDPVPEKVNYRNPSSFKITGNYQTKLYQPQENQV